MLSQVKACHPGHELLVVQQVCRPGGGFQWGGTRGTHHDTSLKVFPLFWGEPSCIVEGRVHIDLNLSPVLIGVHPTWKVVHSHGCSPALGTRHIRRIRSHVYLLVI